MSLYAPDDVNHAATRMWYDRTIEHGEECLVPSIALVEVAAAIARRTGDPDAGRRAATKLRAATSLQVVPMTDDLIEEATDLAAQLRLRAGDAIYVAVAARMGTLLLTWDREQLTRGAALVPTSTPEDDLVADRS